MMPFRPGIKRRIRRIRPEREGVRQIDQPTPVSGPVDWSAKILHVDMDAFFAAIEQRDNPALRGRPVVVGGDPKSRGVVSTASYEARRFGIRSAMPCFQAHKLCPKAIFVRPNFDKYEKASEQIHAIFAQHTDRIEPLSIDEAYLDITRHKLGIQDPVKVAELIKQSIRARTGLTASAGLSTNKLLAKIASGFRKPDGLTVVAPENAAAFLEPLSVREIPGIGPVTERTLAAAGIRTCGELASASPRKLEGLLGKWGIDAIRRARGEDDSPVQTDREPNQFSSETTFARDVTSVGPLERALAEFASDLAPRLNQNKLQAKTVTIKIRYHDFETLTRSRTLTSTVRTTDQILAVGKDILDRSGLVGRKPIRLIGLGVSGLEPFSRIPDQLF